MTALSRSLLILHVRGGPREMPTTPAFEAHSDCVSLVWAVGATRRPGQGPEARETEPREPLGAA